MFGTFLVMAAIEGSLFIDKPHARVFAVTVLAVGLVLRGLASERAAKKRAVAALAPEVVGEALPQRQPDVASLDPLLCAGRLILGSPQRSTLLNLLRGNIIRHVSNLLPENIYLVVCA